jgi:hypothetical protein
MTPEPATLRDFAQRYTAAWCSQDAASVAAFYSPGGSLSVNSGAPAVARGAITRHGFTGFGEDGRFGPLLSACPLAFVALSGIPQVRRQAGCQINPTERPEAEFTLL